MTPKDENGDEEERKLAAYRDLLRRLIQAKGFTLQELDRKFGFSRGYLSRVLKGETTLTLKHVHSILGAIGVPENVYFAALHPPPPVRRGPATPPYEDLHRLLQRLEAALPPDLGQEAPAPRPLPDPAATLEERIDALVNEALAAGRPRPPRD
jgi:transcriptional regulator with XRE-family HTH domain